MNYEVTIGIPVYKAVDYIEKTMESALSQTFDSIEFLVVDDCGNDGTIEVVERFQRDHPRGKDIHILYNNSNLGVGMTRNRILDEGKGKYLYFLDSDDIIEPDTICCLVEKATANQADVVFGSMDKIDLINGCPTLSYILPDTCFLSDDEMALYAFRNYSSFQISICNCLMKFDFLHYSQLRFIDCAFWEDFAFTYEMVTRVSKVVLLSKITYHYLCRSGSLSHYQDREQLEKSEIIENVFVLDYLKGKSNEFIGKSFLPYYCYDLEMNSFYIVCYILKYYQRIVPAISKSEMHKVLWCPVNVWQILQFRHRCLQNLFFWVLSHLPSSLSLFFVGLLGKIKKVI